ncbi:MAG: RagB/SusD family nutrient uptake outer membrane protein, partial [Cyclobacteriaceae bacterium]|nr:RagB/SusD family nutrient uptake outer membrane protein [Cyclobacteriaceae bacterium]
MRKIIIIVIFSVLTISCQDLLDPQPVSLLIDNLALNEAKDVPSVRIGLYSAFRGIASTKVLAGDFTADMLQHNGTFSQYRELGNKQITPSNAAVSSLWGSLYGSIYVANFILEKLPNISGISKEDKDHLLAEAHFVRGYAYFVGLTTFGKMPLVTSTDINTNLNIPRSSENDILDLILGDYNNALQNLPATSVNPGYLSVNATKSALSRLLLYYKDYTQALQFATEVIESNEYTLEPDFYTVVSTDFSSEAILEVGYSLSDDPGTSGTGLNNLFVGRREIIPSNETVLALSRDQSGDRFWNISFDFDNLGGTDNGWSVAKYGTADQNNNNIIIFRLPEMYLIRAECYVELGELPLAEADINTLRSRANALPLVATGKAQMLEIIEKERLYELAYEGHRWY